MDESAQNAQGQPETQGHDGHSDERGLRELALRLARHQMGPLSTGMGTAAEPELFVGRVPPGFSFPLPLPEGARVVGGIAGGTMAAVYLDVPQTPEQALAFYREALPREGWSAPQFPGMGRGGFVPSFGGMAWHQLFCKGEEGPSLNISVYLAAGKPADVRIVLNTHADHPEHNPCAQQRRMRERMGPQIWDVFPALVPPPGAQQQPQGGGGGGNNWHTSAALQTDQALGDVRAQYERQLQDAGWTRSASGESGPVAWSAWTFTDKEGQAWRAIFFVLQEPEEQGAYYLFLQAHSASRGAGFGSAGFSVAPLGSTSAWTMSGHSLGPSMRPQAPPQTPSRGPSETEREQPRQEESD